MEASSLFSVLVMEALEYIKDCSKIYTVHFCGLSVLHKSPGSLKLG